MPPKKSNKKATKGAPATRQSPRKARSSTSKSAQSVALGSSGVLEANTPIVPPPRPRARPRPRPRPAPQPSPEPGAPDVSTMGSASYELDDAERKLTRSTRSTRSMNRRQWMGQQAMLCHPNSKALRADNHTSPSWWRSRAASAKRPHVRLRVQPPKFVPADHKPVAPATHRSAKVPKTEPESQTGSVKTVTKKTIAEHEIDESDLYVPPKVPCFVQAEGGLKRFDLDLTLGFDLFQFHVSNLLGIPAWELLLAYSTSAMKRGERRLITEENEFKHMMDEIKKMLH